MHVVLVGLLLRRHLFRTALLHLVLAMGILRRDSRTTAGSMLSVVIGLLLLLLVILVLIASHGDGCGGVLAVECRSGCLVSWGVQVAERIITNDGQASGWQMR